MKRSKERGLWTASFGQVGATLKVLEAFNITHDELKLLRNNRDFATHLTAFWKAEAMGGEPYNDTEAQSHARTIMGRNFLGLEDVRRYYRVRYTDDQLAPLSTVPFTDETLRQCRDTHVLVPGYPLSLNEMYDIQWGPFFYGALGDPSWAMSFKKEAFATDQKVEARWYLLRKEPVPGSVDKTPQDQLALLTEKEEVPFVCEFAYMVVLYFLVKRERLLQKIRVRCRDRNSENHTVNMGHFDKSGFEVIDYWSSEDADDEIGLAASWKPEL